MTESIDSPYLNKPIRRLDHVSETKRLRDSHDEENPFPKLERKEPEDERRHREDTFEKETPETNEEKEKKKSTLQKDLTSDNTDGPGLVIDVLV